ncbi:MAG TPA: ATP-binding protein [Streptosporangiaceae bacterium]|nr:ATP-binding protein [Streptosporangiaceae bacterium]
MTRGSRPASAGARPGGLSLPTGLAVLPLVQMAACYRVDGHADGGWFDAVPLAGGGVALIVGGVTRPGRTSAAAMGQLGAVLAELLAAGDDLATGLARVDRFAAGRPALRAATLVLAALSPGDGALCYASYGHPPPVIVSAGGRARCLPSTGAGPLATGSAPVLAREQLQRGELLLLHSAGETSRSGPPRPAAHAGTATTADGVCQRTSALLAAANGAADAIALAAQRRPAPVPELNLDLPAIPASLRAARHSLATWLSQLDPLVQNRDTLLLAAGEVLGNAIEHAYPPGQPGRVRMQAVLGDDGHAECRISDRGSWKAPDPAIPGRGAGLMLVGRMIDQLDVHHPPQPRGTPQGARGTVVTLRHRLSRSVAVTSAASPLRAVPAAGPAFQVDCTAGGSCARATVRGPVDASTAGSFHSQLLIACRGGTLPLSVDLTGVTHLGGAGVAALYQVKDQLALFRQTLVLATAPGSAADAVLGLSGLRHDRAAR